MQLDTRAKQIAAELGRGLLTFLRGLRRLLEASRLLDALAYGLACLFVLMPISFVGKGLNWALATESTWFALAVVGFSAALLLLFAALMASEQFPKDIHLQGVKWPSLLSVALAWLAVIVFGGLSCGLERVGVVSINPSVPFADGCASRYADSQGAGKPVHVHCSHPSRSLIKIITVYEPNPNPWIDFEVRKA